MKGLTTEQCEAMVRLSRMPAFSDLIDKVQADEVSVNGYCQSGITNILMIMQKMHINRFAFIRMHLIKQLSLNSNSISDSHIFVFVL